MSVAAENSGSRFYNFILLPQIHHLVRLEAIKDLGAWYCLVKLDDDGVKSIRRKALLVSSLPISVQGPVLFQSFSIPSKNQ